MSHFKQYLEKAEEYIALGATTVSEVLDILKRVSEEIKEAHDLMYSDENQFKIEFPEDEEKNILN